MSFGRVLNSLFSDKHTLGVVSFEYGVVRAIVLSNKQGAIRLVSAQEELLPEESPLVLVPLFEKRGSMIASIKKTLRDVFGRYKPGRVIALVPDSLVTRFVARVTKSGFGARFDHDSVIKDHVEAELRLRGIQLHAVYLEYRVIHQSEGLYELEVSYMSKKDREMISSLMTSVGYPHADIRSSLGTVPSFYYERQDEALVFVDVGEQETVVACSRGGSILARAVVPAGVSHLSHAVSRFHGVSVKEARELVFDKGFTLGLRDSSGLQSELLLSLQPLFREIEHMLRDHGQKSYRFPSERCEIRSGHIYGAGASIRGIAEVLSMRTRLPFRIMDVTPHMRDDDEPLFIPASKLIQYAPLVVAGMMGFKR